MESKKNVFTRSPGRTHQQETVMKFGDAESQKLTRDCKMQLSDWHGGNWNEH